MVLAYSLGDYAMAFVAVGLGLVPFGVSIWALLDVARRPAWAWALASRDRTTWVATVVFAAILPLIGIAVAVYYLARIRPQISAVEAGDFDE